MQVAEVLAVELAHMQFVCAYWLLYLVPHTQKWPANVERTVSRALLLNSPVDSPVSLLLLMLLLYSG